MARPNPTAPPAAAAIPPVPPMPNLPPPFAAAAGAGAGGPLGWMQSASRTVLEKGTTATSYLAEETLRAARASLYLTSHTLEGQVLPIFSSMSEWRQDIERSWMDALSGKKHIAEHARELGERISSGSRYKKLVEGLGRQLFGSAVYAGEQVLAKNDVFRLSYLPAKAGSPNTGVSLFFVGGFIPYGDKLFRFLPEASLFDRYLERGIPVYLMELAGDRHEIKAGLGKVTAEKQIDWIDEMAEVAFRHNGGRKMVLQGYCGSGVAATAYLAARPKDADQKFKLATLFVTPIDAKKCSVFAELVSNLPRSLVWTTLQRSQLLGGYLSGVEMWAGLDTGLKNVFSKTPLGRFASGWKKPGFAKVQTLSDLDPMQRFELAGAYWISVHNADRFPIPVELVRLALHLYDKGASEADGGDLGFTYKGKPVKLANIAQNSQLRMTAFFAGLDKLVQEESGHVLAKLLGPRYRQLTHPTAAHVSYVCFPALWNPAHPKAFLPNPVDVILEDYAKA
ncbi:MAG TPA: hypothetical protein VGK67_11720 [Myxococcales bacterium]